MGLLDTLRETVGGAGETNRGDGDLPAGAYWCHDCSERIPATEVAGEDPPSCPACGEEMSFERSPGTSGCAC